jgi:hypothetical protein
MSQEAVDFTEVIRLQHLADSTDVIAGLFRIGSHRFFQSAVKYSVSRNADP